ncbi:MAG: maltose ABC transporter substrate-binding protein [Spirochaetaceae bacterium]|jgi:arabinogalactan oligomer/maltooligosaccharide transport system substrate-binding protein|nr:maltose ABC transporter substrate-binding protein [Spirochaetaceae bacterium]
MKKIDVAAAGLGALALLFLVIAGISALVIGGAYRKAGAEITAERNVENRVSGPLLVWLDNEDWAKAVIAGFNRRYPEVTVKFENVGNVDSRGKVSLDGPAGIGPDVFLMPHDHIGNAIIDDICLPFPSDMQKKYSEMLLEAAIKTCTSGGELYAVPISTENIAFFYNKDLLGDTPVPQSFEELIAFAEKWNDPSVNKYALRWQVDDSYHNYFFLTAFGMQLFGPNMDDFKLPGFDSPGARQGVEFHTSLRKYYNVNTSDATWDSTVAAFQRGEVPFTITGPWAIGDALKNQINFGITKLPTIKGTQPRCFSGNIVAAVSSYTKNPRAARAFVDFLASIEGETIQFQQTGKLAAYNDISGIEGLRDDVLLKGIMEQAPYADPMPVIPEVNQMWDAQKALFTFTWDGQLSAEEAQKKAMDTYDTSLMMAGKSRFWSD